LIRVTTESIKLGPSISDTMNAVDSNYIMYGVFFIFWSKYIHCDWQINLLRI